MHIKDPLLLKSSTDLREVAPPVTMMALLSSSGISDTCVVDSDSELVEEVEIIAVVGFVVVIIVVVDNSIPV